MSTQSLASATTTPPASSGRRLAWWLRAVGDVLERGEVQSADAASVALLCDALCDALHGGVERWPSLCALPCQCLAALVEVGERARDAVLATRPFAALLRVGAVALEKATGDGDARVSYERAAVNAVVAVNVLVAASRTAPALLAVAATPTTADGAPSWSLAASLVALFARSGADDAALALDRRVLFVVELLDALALLCELCATRDDVVGALARSDGVERLAAVRSARRRVCVLNARRRGAGVRDAARRL